MDFQKYNIKEKKQKEKGKKKKKKRKSHKNYLKKKTPITTQRLYMVFALKTKKKSLKLSRTL